MNKFFKPIKTWVVIYLSPMVRPNLKAVERGGEVEGGGVTF